MIIYLDMDGVLADFFGGLERRFKVAHWKDIKDINDALAQLKDTNFFWKLEFSVFQYFFVAFLLLAWQHLAS